MNRSLLYPRATTTRRLIGLDGMWRFSFDPESKGVEAGWALDLPASLSMPVPASFCDLFTDKASREYCGDFWYETSFFVPAEWSGRDIVLRFGSVTHRARVFVNGVEVAQHEGGFLPFDATVTNIVRYNQFNKLSVLANNELSETMLPAGTTRTLADGRKIAAPYFDFYNYAGIHRPVWLMALPKERVLDYSTRYRLTETGAGLADAEAAFHHEMEGWAKVLHGRPLIFTEYGTDNLSGAHKLPSVMWSAEYQNEYLEMTHAVFDHYDFVQGELVWNFADFQTTEGILRVDGNKKGIFTRQRQPKDAAYLFRKRWTALPIDFKKRKK